MKKNHLKAKDPELDKGGKEKKDIKWKKAIVQKQTMALSFE